MGLKEYLGSNLKKLSYLDLSVSNITGVLFEGIDIPSLKTLYLDFCNKLCNQNLRCLDNFQKLKSLSIFGSDVEIESGKQSAQRSTKLIWVCITDKETDESWDIFIIWKIHFGLDCEKKGY